MERAVWMSYVKNKLTCNIIMILYVSLASRRKSNVRRIWKFSLQQKCPQCVLVLEAHLPPCSSFNMGNRLSNSRNRVFDCSQKLSWRKQEIPVSPTPLWQSIRTYVKQSRCYQVFVICHDLIYESFDS